MPDTLADLTGALDGSLVFFVPGIPKPAGSKTGAPKDRGFGRVGVSIRDACEKTKTWQAMVALAAYEAHDGVPVPAGEPLELWAEFAMPRPKDHFRTKNRKRTTKLHSWAVEAHHTTKPDQGKILRAIEDAMTGIVWADDNQIDASVVVERYHYEDEPTGVYIMVRRSVGVPSILRFIQGADS